MEHQDFAENVAFIIEEKLAFRKKINRKLQF